MRESEEKLWCIVDDMSGGELADHLLEATSLLERFFDAFGENVISDDLNLNKNYLQWHSRLFGSHWIRTDEGWEPGSAKASYIQYFGEDSILEEIGNPE